MVTHAATGSEGLIWPAARNLAAWHEASVAALGHRSERIPGGWLSVDSIPDIYFGWVGTDPTVDPANVALALGRRSRGGHPSSACDPSSRLDLTSIGFRAGERQPWWFRSAGPVASAPHPIGISVEVVKSEIELATYEMVSAEGFGVAPAQPFRWHGPALLADRRFTIFLARLDGRPAGAALAFVEAGAVGVYGVTTVPWARERGLASALTGHAINVAANLPSVLQPSREARGLYARLGYARFAEFATWLRSG